MSSADSSTRTKNRSAAGHNNNGFPSTVNPSSVNITLSSSELILYCETRIHELRGGKSITLSLLCLRLRHRPTGSSGCLRKEGSTGLCQERRRAIYFCVYIILRAVASGCRCRCYRRLRDMLLKRVGKGQGKGRRRAVPKSPLSRIAARTLPRPLQFH
jgi:hypothetical protein